MVVSRQFGNRQLAIGNVSRSAVFLREPPRRFTHFVRQSVIDVNAIDNADDGSFDRHVLVADSGTSSLPEGAHDHLAGPGAQSVGNDDDVSGWLFVEIVRMDNQKPDALEIGRLLGGPDSADYFC